MSLLLRNYLLQLFLLFIGSLVHSSPAWAQESNSTLYDLPKIIPPTPNGAALEKFGIIPVSYSTGVPSIGYPFWNWQRGRLSLNLGLDDHAGGNKVEDMASNVALGWSFTGVGKVTRTVRGIADANTYNYSSGQ